MSEAAEDHLAQSQIRTSANAVGRARDEQGVNWLFSHHDEGQHLVENEIPCAAPI